MEQIRVNELDVRVKQIKNDDFICLSDIAKTKKGRLPDQVIHNWMRNKNTVDFLAAWEELNNPNFNPLEFEGIRKEAGTNAFILTPSKWIEKVNSVGFNVIKGRYGGVYAHKYLALSFAAWISPKFQLFLVTEFDRLKQEEENQKQLDWNVVRSLAKINYEIHTETIKEKLVTKEVSNDYLDMIYSTEADLLNVALFGLTAKNWKELSPHLEGNIRDYANVSQLIVLSNLESLNSVLINEGLSQKDRLIKLNQVAITQIGILTNQKSIGGIKKNLIEKK